MRLIGTKIDVITRTAPIPEEGIPVSRLPADGLHNGCRLQAYLYFASAGSTWTVRRYAYRLTGATVRRCNSVNLRLVCDGAIEHAFDRRDVVNDGRWYVHEHASDVPKGALSYARFEAWFDVPGLAQWAWGDLWDPTPSDRLRGARDRDARARVGPGPRHAQEVERATERA